MLHLTQFVLYWCVVGYVNAKSDASNVKSWFAQLGMECSKDYQITTEELNSMHNLQIPESENARCLLACVYRKAEFFNEKGMFDVDGAIKTIEAHYEEDKKKIEDSKKLYDICKKVNEETVNDGDKGCDRAGLLTKCFLDNFTKFGFKF